MKQRVRTYLARPLAFAAIFITMVLAAGSLKAADSSRRIVNDAARVKIYREIEQINARRGAHQVAWRKAEKAKDADAIKTSKAGLEAELAKLKEATKRLQALKEKPETKAAPK